MSDELKPCPFCGGRVYVSLLGDDGGREEGPSYAYWWHVNGGPRNGDCHCRVFMESLQFPKRDTEEADEKRATLVEKWNRRAK